MPPRYRALVILAAGTGMRQGECFDLVLSKVDFLRRTVRVDQQLVLLPRRPPFLAPPKTSASHRTIPLPQVVVTALSEHVRQFPVTHPDGRMFTDDDGEALRRTAFSREIWRPTIGRPCDVPAALRPAHRRGADELACKPDHGSILHRDDHNALTSGDTF
jgi:integrase